MFKRSSDGNEISLSEARERMQRLLDAQPANVTTTCTEPGAQPDKRVVRGTHAETRVAEPDPPTLPTRRDVLAALSDLLSLCRAVGINGSKDVAEIEIGLSAVFNEALASRVPIASASSLPRSRRLSEQFEVEEIN